MVKDRDRYSGGTARLIRVEPEGSGIIIGDARVLLKKLPSKIFRCCITSPPYWGPRDYCVEGQIGAEKYLPEYLKNLAGVFKEVKRVLTDDGLLWLNLGDTYTSGDRNTRAADKKNPARAMAYRPPTPEGL